MPFKHYFTALRWNFPHYDVTAEKHYHPRVNWYPNLKQEFISNF